MYPHHKETLKRLKQQLKSDENILAVLLCGSIAHGFEKPHSDVDVMIILPEEKYRERARRGDLTYFNKEICTYEEGYIDGKYISIDFMEKVKRIGSEPARFAFEGASVLFSELDGLEALLGEITRYPIEKKDENMKRFYAQFEAWEWYCHEAIKQENAYLLNHSVSNLILFGGRLILAYNEKLYPYHKWFLKILEKAEDKPENLLQIINELLAARNKENITRLYNCICGFSQWEKSTWSSQFIMDSELNWLSGNVPVADI
jgi:predicted nucleotidyltransferase